MAQLYSKTTRELFKEFMLVNNTKCNYIAVQNVSKKI